MTEDLEYATLDRGAATLPPGDEYEILPFDIIRTEDDVAILGNNNSVEESIQWINAEGWRYTGPTDMAGVPGGFDPAVLLAHLRTVRPQVVSIKPVFARFELNRPRRAR